MEQFRQIITVLAYAIESIGVLVILLGLLVATWHFCRTPRCFSSHAAYVEFRHRLGRSIILGLDFLVAGDIIKTIVIESTLDSVAVLAIVVLIRIVLSMVLHVEVEGRWPWQPEQEDRQES